MYFLFMILVKHQARGEMYQTILAGYNSLGEKVTTLIHEQLQSGIYEVQFYARLAKQREELSSGIYFYQLETENFIAISIMLF